MDDNFVNETKKKKKTMKKQRKPTSSKFKKEKTVTNDSSYCSNGNVHHAWYTIRDENAPIMNKINSLHESKLVKIYALEMEISNGRGGSSS